MCWIVIANFNNMNKVSVAGCLGYDVLECRRLTSGE